MKTQTQIPTVDVVMIRHAQSEWNRASLFTGWADPSLTQAGRREAERAADALMDAEYRFGLVYTSRLQRARETAEIILNGLGQAPTSIVEDWRLNERHYGALQGENKVEMAARVGDDQVWRWRRGYADMPPLMRRDDPAHPGKQAQWDDIDPADLPDAESLAMVRDRVMAFWNTEIVPQLQAGITPLIASHGNTLRALLMALDNMTVQEVESFEIPTGVPIVYSVSADGSPIGWRYLDTEESQAA